MAVPDTNTFSLRNVVPELSLTYTTDLSTCFATSIDVSFDSQYKGFKDRLTNFRNYNHQANWINSSKVYILQFTTQPWYGGMQPATGVERENHMRIVYVTGKWYDDTLPLPLTKWVKFNGTDDNLFYYGTTNVPIYNTQRPKVQYLRAMIEPPYEKPWVDVNTDVYSDMALDPEEGDEIYFLVDNNGYTLKALNPSINDLYNSYYVRCDIDGFLAHDAPIPSLSISKSIIYFDADKEPITNEYFDITASAGWYILCDNMDVSVNFYWGYGNKTITTYINTIGIIADISVYKLTNSPAENLSVVVFADKAITLDPATTISFEWNGTPTFSSSFDISSNVNWTSSYSDEGWGYYISPESATIGTRTITVTCPTNLGDARTAYIYFKKGATVLATKTIYQEMYPA